jgi:hypothetical protein
MLKGSKGERRPADLSARAVMTGEETETLSGIGALPPAGHPA